MSRILRLSFSILRRDNVEAVERIDSSYRNQRYIESHTMHICKKKKRKARSVSSSQRDIVVPLKIAVPNLRDTYIATVHHNVTNGFVE
jgi:hypothetical protein